MKKLAKVLLLALAVAAVSQNVAIANVSPKTAGAVMNPGGDPPPTCDPLDPACQLPPA